MEKIIHRLLPDLIFLNILYNILIPAICIIYIIELKQNKVGINESNKSHHTFFKLCSLSLLLQLLSVLEWRKGCAALICTVVHVLYLLYLSSWVETMRRQRSVFSVTYLVKIATLFSVGLHG